MSLQSNDIDQVYLERSVLDPAGQNALSLPQWNGQVHVESMSSLTNRASYLTKNLTILAVLKFHDQVGAVIFVTSELGKLLASRPKPHELDEIFLIYHRERKLTHDQLLHVGRLVRRDIEAVGNISGVESPGLLTPNEIRDADAFYDRARVCLIHAGMQMSRLRI